MEFIENVTIKLERYDNLNDKVRELKDTIEKMKKERIEELKGIFELEERYNGNYHLTGKTLVSKTKDIGSNPIAFAIKISDCKRSLLLCKKKVVT